MPELHAILESALGTRYRIERELGGGGMSRVFVAEEIRFGRVVVIKVLTHESAAGLSAKRFEREIRLAAPLQQANIVPVLGAGEIAPSTGGSVVALPYYTMPFVDRESLRARMEKGPLRFAEAVAVLRDVARALSYAHDRGVVHRDVKPENVLLSGGAAVVTDFGIAKAVSASKTRAPGDTLTVVGTSIGTPAYMAPEQAVGGDVDHRFDIYSWGVVAYELPAGGHPLRVAIWRVVDTLGLGSRRLDRVAEGCRVDDAAARHGDSIDASLVEQCEGLGPDAIFRVPRLLQCEREVEPGSRSERAHTFVCQKFTWLGRVRRTASALALCQRVGYAVVITRFHVAAVPTRSPLDAARAAPGVQLASRYDAPPLVAGTTVLLQRFTRSFPITGTAGFGVGSPVNSDRPVCACCRFLSLGPRAREPRGPERRPMLAPRRADFRRIVIAMLGASPQPGMRTLLVHNTAKEPHDVVTHFDGSRRSPLQRRRAAPCLKPWSAATNRPWSG